MHPRLRMVSPFCDSLLRLLHGTLYASALLNHREQLICRALNPLSVALRTNERPECSTNPQAVNQLPPIPSVPMLQSIQSADVQKSR